MDERIRQAIDACRPGSDDLHADEMADLAALVEQNDDVRRLYDRSQRLDAAVDQAFGDVDLPPGLADRLLAGVESRLAADERPASDDILDHAMQPQPVADSPSPVGVSQVSRQGARRSALTWFSAGAGLVLLMAVVVVAALVVNWSPAPISVDQLVDDVGTWVDQIDHGQWREDAELPESSAYQLESSIHGDRLRWQRIAIDLDSQAVVYDLGLPGRPRAQVFAIRTRQAYDVPTSLPALPISTTGGFSIGACQRDGILFVLVVEGEPLRYRRFVRARLPVT